MNTTGKPTFLLQNKSTQRNSKITLEFSLSNDEVADFRTQIGSNINGTLPISLTFVKNDVKFNVAKRGSGNKVLNDKASNIARFIASRVNIQYIPAVRTADAAQHIVESLLAEELSQIENDPKYLQALNDIAELQSPIIEDLPERIGTTMRQFIPDLKNIRLNIDEDYRLRALRSSAEIFADDGVETLLQYKGDGVQSLAALAMMRHASGHSSAQRDQIVALEEPESHLHPAAIRELQAVLLELSTRHQVVLTTHNPLFANRFNIESNVIVKNNRAIPAKRIEDIREVLGVRLADNLSSAELILLVEGDGDKFVLSSIFHQHSEALSNALKTGRLSIDVLSGAPNLTHRARMHIDSLCGVHVFLDDDKEGRLAYDKARVAGALGSSQVNFASCAGKEESQLEDLYEASVYDEILVDYCGYTLSKHGSDSRLKWSKRLVNLLKKYGKRADRGEVDMLKARVAQSARDLGMGAIATGRKGPIDSLCKVLESRLTTGK